MKFPYVPVTFKDPIPSLGGSRTRHRPIVAVRLTGPSGTWLIDGLADSGSDETVFEEWIAGVLGLDLTHASYRDIGLVGRVKPVRCKYVSVQLRITDGTQEVCECPALVGFTATRLRYPLLGHAGFLQFFNSDFRGSDLDLILTPNSSFPGSISQPTAGPRP
jgi:hypothetical protein